MPVIVFWWTGKGYLTAVILLATVIAFAFVLRAGSPILHDGGPFWGVALLVAGALNWVVGRKQNARKLAAVRSDKLRHRLIYPARNRFMSLPFEVWSIPMIVGGIVAIASGISGH